MERAIKALARFIGGDDPNSQVLGMLNPTEVAAGPVAKAIEALAKRLKPIKAYHGSPHDFDKFSLDKIGTGEGAQAYGHGLYFAENPKVAEEYKKVLSGRNIELGNGRTIVDDNTTKAMNQTRGETIAAQHINDAFNAQSSAPYQFAKDRLLKAKHYYPEEAAHIDEALSILGDWNRAGGKAPLIAGKTYEVNIHADPNDFLDWDAPLSQQSEKVQGAVKSLGPNNPRARDFWERVYWKQDPSGASVYQDFTPDAGGIPMERKAAATQKLRESGVSGIKYYDQGSRGAKEGTRNYVVFDEKLIEIVKKYGIAVATAGGLINEVQAQQLREQGYQ
jgi:hypothetical protein